MTTRSSCRSFLPARRRRGLAVVALLLTVAAAAGSAGAQSDEEIIRQREQSIRDTEAEREKLARAAAAAAEGLDAATAEAGDLIDALNRAQAAVDAQQAALDEAERAVADALAVVREAEDRIAELEDELVATREGLKEAVIESYVSFQAPTGTFAVLGKDPWENAREEALAGFATGSRIDDIDELRRIGEELERWRLLATEAAAEAEAQRLEANSILLDLQAAADLEAQLSVAAEERVERRLYEVQTLKQIDAQYAAEIEADEREIAAALARQRAAEEARRRAEEEARRRAEAEARRQAEADAAEAAGRQLADSVDPSDPDLQLVWVGGIEVNVRIAAETRGAAGRHGCGGIQPGRLGLPQQPGADPAAAVTLRHVGVGGVVDAVEPVPAADGAAGPQQPREGLGHRLHQQRPAHHQPQQRGVPGTEADRPGIRLQEPPQRALALVGRRPLTARAGCSGSGAG